jgi:hypothetical protein
MVRLRALLLIASAILAAGAFRAGLAQHLPIICPLRRLTGIPCASCGLTRAAAALCHGQVAAAETFNLAAIPLSLIAVLVLVLIVWEAVTQRPIIRPAWARCSGVLTWLGVALMLSAWLVNLHRHFAP